jgi:hypothetical protein
MILEPICFNCIHFIDNGRYTCQAFPQGIPDEVLTGENDHSQPLPAQDNEIVYTPADGRQ